MKRVLLLCLTLVVALSSMAAPKSDKSIKMRVGTYNVWSDGARQWKIDRNQALGSCPKMLWPTLSQK